MKKYITFLLVLFIAVSSGAYAATAPTTAPAAPTKEAIDVISVYSDSYTSIATNINPFWWQATVMTEIDFDGNKVLKYGGLNYQGLEYTNSDISTMEFLHVDYWTSDATQLEIFLIAGVERTYNIASKLGIVTGEWVSIDIPLSHYENAGCDLTDAGQFKTEGNGTVYLDNLYFWKNPTPAEADVTLASLMVEGKLIGGFASAKGSYSVNIAYNASEVPTITAAATNPNAIVTVTNAASVSEVTTIKVVSEDGSANTTYTVSFNPSLPDTEAPTPTYSAENVISVFCDEYPSIATNLSPGWGQATQFSIVKIGDNEVMKYANLNYQGTEYTNPTDVSGMDYVHFDFWTKDATDLSFFLIAEGENAYDIAAEVGIKTKEWVSVDIPLSYYANAGRDLTKAFQFKTTGNGTVFIDNLFFYKNVVSSIASDKVEGLLSIYPNPATDLIRLNVPAVIEVFDITGRSVLKSSSLVNRVDVSFLSRGAYVLIANVNDNIQAVRFIKE